MARTFGRDAVAARPLERAEAETIPALVEAHGVTHLQCTPSMAQILLQDEPARRALGRLRQMLVGGEALPAASRTSWPASWAGW